MVENVVQSAVATLAGAAVGAAGVVATAQADVAAVKKTADERLDALEAKLAKVEKVLVALSGTSAPLG